MGPTGKGSGSHKMEMERLRREDHLRVKHDKLFSDWKILIGSADWNDHIAGEEGSHKYRLHNLPSSYFGPGVYELGLTQHATTQESKHGKLRRHAVVVVYLGQADNVRQRLQRYGQTGSHLEGSRAGVCSVTDKNVKIEKLDENVKKLAFEAIPPVIDTGTKLRGWLFQPGVSGGRETSTNCNIQGGLRLFTEVFSRGYSIAFRWAKTESKQMAEKVEAELLHIFDYPWNTALNGARRPRDILAKLDLLQLELERSLCLGRALGIGSRKWAYFGRKVGISVPAKKPTEPSPTPAKIPTSFFFSPARCGGGIGEGERGANDGAPFCGALLEDGSACRVAPVKGRKRCPAHKGQRTKVSTRRPAVEHQQAHHNSNGARTGSSNESTAGIARSKITGRDGDRRSTTGSDSGSETGRGPTTVGTDRGSSTGGSDTATSAPTVVIIRAQMQGKRVELTDVSGDGLGFRGFCGAVVEGGSSCMNPPVHGRRRCATHKGMRTANSKHPMKGFTEEDADYCDFSRQMRHSSYSGFAEEDGHRFPAARGRN